MLATWGLSLALVGAVTLVMGPTTEGVATPLGSFELGRYSVSVYRLVAIAISVGAVLGTYVVLRYTRTGLIARATMQAPLLVAASGVEPPSCAARRLSGSMRCCFTVSPTPTRCRRTRGISRRIAYRAGREPR
jgi:branched-subunit amino acid ABC-type transport system permease component